MIKRILWMLLLVLAAQTSWAYSLGGPIGNGGDAWQVPIIGYGLGGDLNAPKNLGEEYRRNTPVMYYAYNANFLDYFGPEGTNAVDSAFAVLNSLTNVDKYSKALSEFSTETRHVNFQAQALGLIDLKTETLGLMVEQLGLTDPVRYDWTLRERIHVGPIPCPVGMEYWVAQRNYDIVSSPLNQLQYSPYVNDILYSYQIVEICTGPNPLAVASPFSVDPLAATFSPVASDSTFWGDYYTGLTRDDMAGLRYLLTTNNVNWETPAANSLGLSTNLTAQQLFPVSLTTSNATSVSPIQVFNGVTYGTSSYADLVNFASTNDPVTLSAAYPGVQFTLLDGPTIALVTVTNIVSYFTNLVGSPANSPVLVTKKVPTPTWVTTYTYRFNNIITNLYGVTTVATNQTITVAPPIGAPIGSPSITNVSNQKVTLKVASGEFYILPTNSPCGIDIITNFSVAFTNYTTNIITVTTSTNTSTTTTNANFYEQIQIIPFVGHIYKIHPVTCTTSNAITGLYQGIGNIKFVRTDFDSLIGQFWQPMTNDYSMIMITNGKAVTQHFRRIVTQPDFLFSAADLLAGNELRNLNFNTANVLPGLAGPGTITTPTEFIYNKVGPLYFDYFFNAPNDVMDGAPYFNETPGGDTNDLFYSQYFIWASYDGSTNTPIVFPNGTSIDNLQNQLLTQVSPASLPLGAVNTLYSPNSPVQFTASGGGFIPPFTWSEIDGVLGGMGLTLSPDGTLSGTPTQSGTFDFNITLTDSQGRTVYWPYSITVIQVSPDSLADGTANSQYPNTTFTISGDAMAQPFNWSAAGLPDGMVLSNDGTLSGTPTQSGVYGFTVTVTDSAGRSAQLNYTITIH
jgi:hypothetical protein